MKAMYTSAAAVRTFLLLCGIRNITEAQQRLQLNPQIVYQKILIDVIGAQLHVSNAKVSSDLMRNGFNGFVE